ncbi:4'-phosphopantetheinyl transferase superfamily protein [Mucilaginibacter yixingensis]|uniref:4'-phosphopantetheinyl transferase superfamily protein n=1 Tax=Mucilaginibacter yixingensis TaxID=1295612 RepID=A0A2T5JD52_9SPHI|nr:4'-phosphopantetheinyl transferase superfamily protein [Mucilaginibacter yixingensis]PTQ99689.1 4'-phosphopantetheinyl transferase superfamily protein [Mucilaginibacter yixingensis]
MPSIGNDIVDLRLIDADRSRQARFYSKILAPDELDLYEPLGAFLAFEHFVWLCWTIKEASYKYSKRLHPQLLFSPPRTVILDLSVCQNADDGNHYEGTCSNGFSTVYFQSSHTATYIHTIVNVATDLSQIIAKAFIVDPTKASAQTHAQLLQQAAQLYPGKAIRIEKNADNVPSLMVDAQTHPISIAHHGQYGSFAIANNR